MRVFIIDTRNMAPELQGGLIGVIGSSSPTVEEKQECIERVTGYATDGWAIAADPFTPIGRLAALTAETACARFVSIGSARLPWSTVRTMGYTRRPEWDSADLGRSPFPALPPEIRISSVGMGDSHLGYGGR